MNGKISRRNALLRSAQEQKQGPAPDDACPCCGEASLPDPESGRHCPSCGYPSNSAAWIDYDGCC